MDFLNLAATSEKIPLIGLGTMGLGGYFLKDSSRDQEYINLIRNGVELGLTFIDTAEVYGAGHTEELIGKAINKKRSKVFLASKFSPEHSSFHQVVKSCEYSLKRLQTDYIDLYQIHWPNYDVPLDEIFFALEVLVKKGKIRFVGVCNFPLSWAKEVLKRIKNPPFCSIQDEFNLLNRTAEKQVISFCQKNQLTFIAYSPLDQGKFKDYKHYKMLEKIAKKYQKSVSQIILRWIINHRNVIAIPKASSLKHLQENASTVNFKIDGKDLEQIDSLFKTKVVNVPAAFISVAPGSDRKVYLSKKEALANTFNDVPSPKSMAFYLQKHLKEDIKPIKIKRQQRQKNGRKFILEEGRVRYWAWVIAFGKDSKIPCLIRD